MAILHNGKHGKKLKSAWSSADRPVSLFRLLEDDKDFKHRPENSLWTSLISFARTVHHTFYGRTWRRFSLPNEGECFNGCFPDLCNAGMGWHGEFLTVDFSESRSIAVESSLLDVLETQSVPEKYYLKPKRCQSIIRQAKQRGKRIPEPLRSVITRIACKTEWTNTPQDTDKTIPLWEL